MPTPDPNALISQLLTQDIYDLEYDTVIGFDYTFHGPPSASDGGFCVYAQVDTVSSYYSADLLDYYDEVTPAIGQGGWYQGALGYGGVSGEPAKFNGAFAVGFDNIGQFSSTDFVTGGPSTFTTTNTSFSATNAIVIRGGMKHDFAVLTAREMDFPYLNLYQAVTGDNQPIVRSVRISIMNHGTKLSIEKRHSPDSVFFPYIQDFDINIGIPVTNDALPGMPAKIGVSFTNNQSVDTHFRIKKFTVAGRKVPPLSEQIENLDLYYLSVGGLSAVTVDGSFFIDMS